MLAIDQILRLPLLPLLVLQGILVRRQALILPEPDGPRLGHQGQGPELRLLIAGDSSAAGVGVTDQTQALSGQLATTLAPHFDLHWQLEATTGHKTRDTITRLQALPKQHFDVVALALGVNDVTSGTSRRSFAKQQEQLMQLLETRFAPQLVLVSGVPQMQYFPALPQPLAWVLGRQSARLDSVLQTQAQQRNSVLHLPFDLPQDPALAARDGYHPSAQAYHLWASVLAERVIAHFPGGS
jgi:lysophospholipase L1-like esterase